MINSRSLPLCVLAGAFLCSVAAVAQQAAPAARIVGPIDESQLVTLKGNVSPHANAKNDRGPVSSGFALPDLALVLSRSPEQQSAFDAFVASQYDSGSPNYHQWLTPAQIGVQFGPAQADIATITGWLASHGLVVKSVAPDRMTIRFGGTAAQVESAFHTQIHNLSVNGVSHYANMSDPQIPAALASVVVGVKRLHNFLPHPLHKMGSLVQFNREAGKWQRVVNTAAAGSKPAVPTLSLAPLSAASKPHPQFGINGGSAADEDQYLEEDVTPWDFAKIYDLPSTWPGPSSIGSSSPGYGQTIAIAGTSLIDQSSVGTQSYSGSGSEVSESGTDVATFRSAFDLPALSSFQQIDTKYSGTTATVCTSTNPDALCGIGDLEENSLDVELSGAVATGASIVLVVTGQNSTGTVDTVYDSAAYVVDNLTARILSVSYGECELGSGTAENVAYYDLWQSAAAEGISVFVAAGDSGSPSCDDGQDELYGNPYLAQYGLSVSSMASTPFDTAVGGTDFSWCQPYFNSSGDFEGCPISSTTQTSNGENKAYWSTSNSTTTGESALGYVPEIPWNDTCENPILARSIETLLSSGGADSALGFNPTTPEETCNILYEYWSELDSGFEAPGYFELYVDTVGGSGGASNCVVNDEATEPDDPTCTAGSTSTGAANGSIPLVNDGWPVPTWQSGVTGISGLNLTTRAVPDVSFFAGNGALDSATLICVSAVGSCAYSSTTENTAQEVGGTSVGTPEMAGVMALIDQKAGAAQGLANPGLYKLASEQTYSECSAESVTNSSSCYFQDIDNGPTAASGPAYANAQTNSMPCDLDNAPEGGDLTGGEPYEGTTSPNCTALNSGDTYVGTLVTTQGGTTPAYNSTTGFDLATGLGSLNVANVVNAWTSDEGTNSTTLGVVLNPTGTLTAGTPLEVTVTVTGSAGIGTPTGTIVVSGGGASGSGTLTQTVSGAASVEITIPAGTLAVGSDTLTVSYSGDSNYASTSTTETVSVSAAAPTVTVSAPASDNVANAVLVTVTVTGSAGMPTGTATLSGGGYNSSAVTLSSGGTASFTIPANTLTVTTDTLTATYSGNSDYTSGTGTASIIIVNTALLTPAIKITPTPTTIDTSQTLTVGVAVSGTGATPTGTASVTAGSYTSAATALVGGLASFTIPSYSLSQGSQTITANYSGDANYASGSNTATETVTQSVYALSATTPAAVSPGTASTSTISGASSTDYTGTVTLNSCSLTSSSVSSPNSPPNCTVTGTITFTNGTASGSGTATVTTTAASVALAYPRPGTGGGWLGAGGSMVLALLVFFGIPARRRSWRSMLGLMLVTAVLGLLSSCGGSSGGGTSITTPATSAGTYTFTVSGTGNDPATTAESTTFTLTVN